MTNGKYYTDSNYKIFIYISVQSITSVCVVFYEGAVGAHNANDIDFSGKKYPRNRLKLLWK